MVPQQETPMPDNPVLQKLRMKSGQRAVVVGAPESVRAAVTDVPEGVDLSESLAGQFDFILCFVTTKLQAEQMAPSLKAAMKPGAILWLSYPKGKSMPTDLNRDVLFAAMKAHGLQAVSNVAIDEVWSALRFKVV